MFEFTLQGTAANARAGSILLPHGTVETPAFMPVGTYGAVRGLHPAELERAGAQIILGNTYHLHVRPGEATIQALGGLHGFTSWRRPMLTDSGGFQVFSLQGLRSISEEGVEFQNPLNGDVHFLTPERATEIQWALGADVAMAFDHVVPGQAPHHSALEGMERTLRWLERCASCHNGLDRGQTRQTLWPIIQGGAHEELRLRSAEETLARGSWSGIAIGGLSVGEPKSLMHRLLELLHPVLPPTVPRYLMGVGFPPDLLEGIARGVDLFDCVAATRNGRHGSAWTASGRLNIRAAQHRTADEPIDPECDCEVCARFSRAYLRHLFMAEDMLGLRLVSIHNVRFAIRLTEQARAHVLDGTFEHWSRRWLTRYHERGNE
ncbi:MAG: tRNA guanosine(34) transglycosylase Tgt [Gemmatimonadales bacterium]|nr:tRNA guanosine(34) transglycosylase Tgt [Gemmatimonadales bacterium]